MQSKIVGYLTNNFDSIIFVLAKSMTSHLDKKVTLRNY